MAINVESNDDGSSVDLFYLLKNRSNSELGGRVEGLIPKYFSDADVGVIQNTALAQLLNTSEFKPAAPGALKQGWATYLAKGEEDFRVVSGNLGTDLQFIHKLTWTVDFTGTDEEVARSREIAWAESLVDAWNKAYDEIRTMEDVVIAENGILNSVMANGKFDGKSLAAIGAPAFDEFGEIFQLSVIDIISSTAVGPSLSTAEILNYITSLTANTSLTLAGGSSESYILNKYNNRYYDQDTGALKESPASASILAYINSLYAPDLTSAQELFELEKDNISLYSVDKSTTQSINDLSSRVGEVIKSSIVFRNKTTLEEFESLPEGADPEDFDEIKISLYDKFVDNLSQTKLGRVTTMLSGIEVNHWLINNMPFTSLIDTPTGYESGYYLKSSATGIEYIDVTGLAKELSPLIGGVSGFSGLHDTPTGYQSGYYLRSSETGIEYLSPQDLADDVADEIVQTLVTGKLMAFTGLYDTPTGYLSGYYVRANETGIEYIHPTGLAKELSEHLGAGDGTFTGLQDTPSNYLSGYYIKSTEKGLEYIDPTGLAKTIPSIPQGYLTLEEIPSMPSKHDGELIKVGCDLYLSCDGQWKKVSSDEDSNLLDPSLVDFYPDCVYTNADAIAYNAYKSEVEAENLSDAFGDILNGGASTADTMGNICLSATVDGNIVKPNIVSSVSTACDSPFENNTFNPSENSILIDGLEGISYDTDDRPTKFYMGTSQTGHTKGNASKPNLIAVHGDYAFVADSKAFFNKDAIYMKSIRKAGEDNYTISQGDHVFSDGELSKIITNVTFGSNNVHLGIIPHINPSDRDKADSLRSDCHHGRIFLYKRNGNSWDRITNINLNGESEQYIFDKNGYIHPSTLAHASEFPESGFFFHSLFGESVAWDGETLVVCGAFRRKLRAWSSIEPYWEDPFIVPVKWIFNTSQDGQTVNLEAVYHGHIQYGNGSRTVDGAIDWNLTIAGIPVDGDVPFLSDEMFEILYGNNVQRLIGNEDLASWPQSGPLSCSGDRYTSNVAQLYSIFSNITAVYNKNIVNLSGGLLQAHPQFIEIIAKNSDGLWYTKNHQRIVHSCLGSNPNFYGGITAVTFLGDTNKIAMTFNDYVQEGSEYEGPHNWIRILEANNGGEFNNFCDLVEFNIYGNSTIPISISFDEGILTFTKIIPHRTRVQTSDNASNTSLVEPVTVVLDISELLKIIDEGNISGEQLATLAIDEAKEKFEVWANRWKPWFKNLKIVDPDTGIPTGETPSQEDVDQMLNWDRLTLENDGVAGAVSEGSEHSLLHMLETAESRNRVSAAPKVIINHGIYVGFHPIWGSNGNIFHNKMGHNLREFDVSLINLSPSNRNYGRSLTLFSNLLEDIIKRPVKKRVCTSAMTVTDFQNLSIDDYIDNDNAKDYLKHTLFFGYYEKGTYTDAEPLAKEWWGGLASTSLGDSAYADCESDSLGYAELPYIYDKNYDIYSASNGAQTSVGYNSVLRGDNLLVSKSSENQVQPQSYMVFDITDCGGYSYILLSDNVKVKIDETSYRWGIFQQGETINITATVGDGCSFIGWSTTDPSILGTPTAETSTLTVPGDVSVVGLFSCN